MRKKESVLTSSSFTSGRSDEKLKKAKLFFRECKRHKGLLIMLIPGIAWFIIFKYIPMYGVTIAFKNYRILKGILGSPWAGFRHFERLFNSSQFGSVFWNTLILGIYRLIFVFPASIAFAILLNEITHLRFKKAVQTITYLPHFLSWVVVATFIHNILSPVNGVLNIILQFFGLGPYKFLMMPEIFRGILIISEIWKGMGWGSIVYLAAITGIDPQLYEAATMDGVTRIKQIWYITIPMILPVIVIMFLMKVGNIMEGGREQILNLYNPIVYRVGDVLDTYSYRVGLVDFDYSYSTAVSLFQNVIGIIFLLVSNIFTRRVSDQGLW
ncbi:MAG TPA: sugar ABC transporter permease [Clostridiaceae bacterium]|nr:sugar ABC transporter permease [Clostridiaceae bacterium]